LDANTSFEGFKGVKIDAEILTIEEGSSISANGKGYPAGQGLGAGNSSAYRGSGGGYGGKGGDGSDSSYRGGLPYGSAIAPVDLGSGGGGPGGTINNIVYICTGGPGGGAIKLNISGTLTLYGVISTNGGNAIGSQSGGGSGGSIYIITDTLSGYGSIISNGGKSGPIIGGGAGGGGRIAIYYKTSSFSGKAEARGDIGLANNGENGTVGLFDYLNNDFYAGHSWRFQINDSQFIFNNVTLNGSITIPENGFILNAKNNIVLKGNSTINGSISLNAKNLNIEEGSYITANGKGYPAGQGLGAGNSSTNGGSGGGYGGKGGDGDSPLKSGGLIYGSAISPVDLGSGGGGPRGTINNIVYNSTGGPGGGAIKLNISGILTLYGLISANGGDAIGSQSGGGSGGSIYIITDTLSGYGSIISNGGKSGPIGGGAAGGGGGGGRIAIYYKTFTYTGKKEAKGGVGIGNNGREGTSVFIDTLNNILYTGHSFIFQENDSPLNFNKLILNNSNVTTQGNVRLITDDLVLENYSILTIYGNETLNINDISIANHSILTHISQGKIDFNLVNLNLDPTSTISANGKGYPASQGLGAGFSSTYGGSGGGYGGRGGAGGCSEGIGLTYGSSIVPIDSGSGGGGPGYTYNNIFYDSSGGSGGGIIDINIIGNFTINGLISANGSNGGYPFGGGQGGGGSGGSIFIKTSNISGSGLITADGGSSGPIGGGCAGGGGGGGRVAIYYQTSIFNGKIETKGGIAQPTGNNGQNGTEILSEFIYTITPNNGPNIISINATITGKNFTEGVDVKLVRAGESDINGEDALVLSENLLTTRFNLSMKKTGMWNLVVRFPDGNESILPEAFEIKSFVYGIFPNSVNNLIKPLVTIYGFGFKDGITVKLTKEGEEDIIGQSIELLSNTRLTAKFNISGKAIGLWNIVVTMPGREQEITPNAFTILDSTGGTFLQSLQAGQSQEFEINVPNTHNLYITLQKTTLAGYGVSWNGKMSLLRDGKEIVSTSGYHDLILKIVDPVPGIYDIKINAINAGSGVLNVYTKLPELPYGEWIVDTIYTSYGSIWRQVEVLPNQKSLFLEAEGMGAWSHFDIYYDRIGSSKRWVSQYGSHTSIDIPNPDPGTYIVEFIDSAMIYGKFQWSEDQKRDILLKADGIMNVEPAPDYLPIITSISPVKGGNAGFVTVEIKGGWLDPNATVMLVRSNYEDILAQNVFGSSNGTALIATFNLQGKASGEWNLTVINPNGRNVTAHDSFSIEESGKSELWVEIVGREKIRSGRPAQYILRYGNSGNVDMPAPLFVIFTSGTYPEVSLSLTNGEFNKDTLQILGKGTGSQGILNPGSSYSIPFYMRTNNDNIYDLQVSAVTGDQILEVNNLASALDAIYPAPSIPLEFGRVFLKNSAYYGPLGYGWVHGYDARLKELSDGTVVLVKGNSYSSFFLRNGSGNYTEFRGHNTLSKKPDGTFILKEIDGTTYGFRTDLRFDHVEDVNGNRISAVYDSGNNLTKIQHSDGDFFDLEYNANVRISRLIDHRGRVTEYQYNPDGTLLLNVTTPDGFKTSYNYEPIGNKLSSITYPDGMQEFIKLDGNKRLSERYLNNKDELIQYSYDVDNSTTYITDALGNRTTVQVDEFGRITLLKNPLDAVIRYEYDANSNLIREIDPSGNTYNFSYDKAGNVFKVTNPLNHDMSMEYENNFHKLSLLNDTRGNRVTFGYDIRGNLLNITYPDSSKESMEYDSTGNPASVKTRKGDVINYTYNNNGQLTSKEYPDGSWAAYGYDASGNMISASDQNGTITMEYNTNDFLINITYPNGYFFNYSYDSVGRIIQRTDQDGNALNYEYDSANRMMRLSNESNSDIVKYEYDKLGRLSKKILGNGAYTIYGYDAAGQILHLVNYNGSDAILSRFDYTYDLAGNPISINTVEGIYNYEYDKIGQLTKVTYPDGRYENYSYDAAGNRIAVDDNRVNTTYTTNNLNQYTQAGNVSYSYDANGNLVSETKDGKTTTYQYNFEDRLIKVASPEGTWEYKYDALGSRVGVVHNGIERRYLVEPVGFGNVVAEYDGNGSLFAHYIQGSGLISKIDNNGKQYYYHFNPTGNTMQITDINGNVANSYEYSPFGKYLKKTETIQNPFGYVGEFGIIDDGNGLNYMRMRSYQLALGRFTTIDPYAYMDGLNLYLYCLNSPSNCIDPAGLKSVHDTSVQNRINLLLQNNRGDVSEAFKEVWDKRNNPIWKNKYKYDPVYRDVDHYLFAADFVYVAGKYGLQVPAWLFVSFYTPAYSFLKLVFIDHIIFGLWDTTLPTISEISWGLKGSWQQLIQSVTSTTPEDKYGPTGFDLPSTPQEERKHFIQSDKQFNYRVDFWNKEDATAPACDVYIKDQLDTKLNWSTFRFKEIGFLNWSVPLEPTQYFNLYVDTRPEMNLLVNVEGVLDSETGGVNWTFRCLDPVTLDTPEDPMAGFLPPITSSGHEIGWAGYSIEPESGLTTGTQIQNQAFVNFDGVGPFNPAPKEGPWVNTIDAVPPASNMTAALLEGNAIQLNWTGEDDLNGSGIRDYSIYVSDNGSEYEPLLVQIINTSAVIAGESGHTYAFYSLSTDNVGYVERAPDEPDATVICPLLTDTEPPASVTNLSNTTYASTYVNWTWTDPQDIDFDKVMIYLNGIFQRNVTNGTQYYNATVVPGTYTIGTKTVDVSGNINATMVTHTATTILPAIRFINGTVIDSVNKTGISGVMVSTNTTFSSKTNASGFYSFAVTSGTYNLTAKFEPTYYVNNTIMVSTVLSAVVAQDIEIVKKPTGNITGSVTKTQ
jgi:RHS repeat-associated protein